ncbi:replication factor C subunit 1, partial [Coemansia sp. RSA 2131]
MPRKRKAEDLSDDSDVDPEDFFGAVPGEKSKAKPKAKPRAKPKAKEEEPSEALASMDIDDNQSTEVGFAASDLPEIAPKKFWKAPAHSAKSGSVDIPDGDPECLSGLTFVITGEFVGLSREGLTDLIKTFGGKVTSAVSGRTSYLVVGDDPGSSKVKKAKTLGTRCLRENDLLELIRSSKKDNPEPAAESDPEPVVDIKPVISIAEDVPAANDK